MIKRQLNTLPGLNTYGITGTNLMVRYVGYCQGAHHDLEREATVLRDLNRVAPPEVAFRLIYDSSAIPDPSAGWFSSGKMTRKQLSALKCPPSERLVKYIITGRVERTLHDILAQYGKLPLHLVAHIGLQLLRAIRGIHTAGMYLARTDLHTIGNVMGNRPELTIVSTEYIRYEREGFGKGEYSKPLLSTYQFM
jgi:hypothetical protein